MRLSIRFLILLVPVLGVVVAVFNGVMDHYETQWDQGELHSRGNLIFNSIQDPVREAVATGKLNALLRIYRRQSDDPSLVGIMVCAPKGTVISKSGGFPRDVKCDWSPKDGPTEVQAKLDSFRIEIDKRIYHRSIFPLFDRVEEAAAQKGVLNHKFGEGDDEKEVKKRYRGYVQILHDPAFLTQRSATTRLYTLYAFLGLAFLISIITLMVYRWSGSRSVEQISQMMKGVFTGDSERFQKALESSDFAPLVKDLDQMLVEFRRNRVAIQGGDENALWDPIKLNQQVQEQFGDSRFCVVAMEEPYIHTRRGTRVVTTTPPSGIVSATEPVIRACSGVWIAHGKGTADREKADKHGVVLVPENNPEYALKRVWLSREEEQGFDYGFSQEGLWPLCHMAHERPLFRKSDWEQYVSVNAKFASAFSEEMKATRPVAIVQGHHFALMPSMIRRMRPDCLVSLIWHIPWPSPESIRICPWRKELLTGMLGADVVTFQMQYHCNNFLDSVDRFLEARVSRDHFTVTIQGHTCQVRVMPTSVAWPSPYAVEPEDVKKVKAEIFNDLAIRDDGFLGVSVDRLDYTKGIVERMLAIEAFLDRYPDYVGRLVFVQVVSPSRMHLKRYQDLSAEIQKVAERINWKFYSADYQPIVLRNQHQSKEECHRLYQAADFYYVNSIHDGMNLGAKEFISSRSDVDGVLILSTFTGAARRLPDAITVNPYDTDECIAAIKSALTMDKGDRQARMSRMRAEVANNNCYAWAHKFLNELNQISERQLHMEPESPMV